MIAEIGIIVGLYIITRMTQLFQKPSDKPSSAVRALSMLTIAVTALVLFDLVTRGLTAPIAPSL